jgi:hypothetical protein
MLIESLCEQVRCGNQLEVDNGFIDARCRCSCGDASPCTGRCGNTRAALMRGGAIVRSLGAWLASFPSAREIAAWIRPMPGGGAEFGK